MMLCRDLPTLRVVRILHPFPRDFSISLDSVYEQFTEPAIRLRAAASLNLRLFRNSALIGYRRNKHLDPLLNVRRINYSIDANKFAQAPRCREKAEEKTRGEPRRAMGFLFDYAFLSRSRPPKRPRNRSHCTNANLLFK